MRILIDTHIYLWWLDDDEKLSQYAEDIIANADDVYVSAISIWETTIKAHKGKLKTDPERLIHEIGTNGFQELPVAARHSLKLLTLPSYHNDPFDRMLIAQAMTEPLKFLTADKSLTKYSELVMVV